MIHRREIKSRSLVQTIRRMLSPAMLMGMLMLGGVGASPLWAVTYYVGTNGDNARDKTQAQNPNTPWRTIQKAADMVGEGDRVIVKRGTYYERVIMKTSGSLGAPIVFEAEPGVIVDGSDATTGWVRADEIGAGVWKTNQIPYNPHSMIADGDKETIRIADSNMQSNKWENWKSLMTQPAAATVETTCTNAKLPWKTVNYWDGHEAFYGSLPGVNGASWTTYMRFRNGESPALRNTRSSPGPPLTSEGKLCFSCWPQGSVFRIDNKSHIHIKNFTMRGAQWSVALFRAGASTNVIEGNVMLNGRGRVYLGTDVNNNIVRNNRLERRALGFDEFPPRASGRSANCDPSLYNDPYGMGVAGRYYRTYKYVVGDSNEASGDVGVKLTSAGPHNQIYGNTIRMGAVGMDIADTSDTHFFNNTIHNMACQGAFILKGATNLYMHDNLIYDMNIHIRPQDMQAGNRRVYIYRNRFYNPPLSGAEAFYFHFWPNSTPPSQYPEFYIYHNTTVGGHIGFGIGDPLPAGGLKGAVFVNNIFSTHQFYTPWVPSAFLSDASMVGGFDYNWAGGAYARGRPAWFPVPHNTSFQNQQLWEAKTMPNFYPPEGRGVRGTGIDVSRHFSVAGKSHGSLPGFNPGYFTGLRPDMGAIQSSVTSEDSLDGGDSQGADMGEVVLIRTLFNPAQGEFGEIQVRALSDSWTGGVVNRLGQRVRDGLDVSSGEGGVTVRWNGRTNTGALVASGVYTLILQSNTRTLKQKMVVVK